MYPSKHHCFCFLYISLINGNTLFPLSNSFWEQIIEGTVYFHPLMFKCEYYVHLDSMWPYFLEQFVIKGTQILT